MPCTCLAAALLIAACAAPPAETRSPPAVPAPQAARAGKAQPLTVKVWTCAAHPQLRMIEQGACPLCTSAVVLVAKEVAISGPGAASPYPLDTCPVSGMGLGTMGAPVILVHEGREVRFCCKDCVAPFQAEPARYLAQVDQKLIERQLPHYALKTCPVSDESLDAMGEPVNIVYDNRLVRFCCNMCVRKFRQAPAEYIAKLDAAILAQQKAGYPLATCMVSGQKLGGMGEPLDYIVADHLVRFCCAGCLGAFYRNPAEYLAKLDKAWADKGDAVPGSAHGSGPAGKGGS
jgi:YHS domain-containing protein